MSKTLAEMVVELSYESGAYLRLRDQELAEMGGRLVASSNDGASVISFSPTDTWEFAADGSSVLVAYSDAEVVD